MNLEKPKAAYATMSEGMDKRLGDLMDYLEKHDLVDNTNIIFLSENGGYSPAPQRGTKFFYYSLVKKEFHE